ncbi:hypothetical protein EZJ43_12540 [Pedobacter changchengzhani]|uniref:Uncharacterized protein n=1 Tax=Pedobacter changchengzhani TaxID=2529274 RepID=A0A4R5MIW2_9SPHI|nr:hypothetical protein [Pedobacter changchengzhani]TDG35452.1 hypothetical protein EZJ43_12540 [Pedobacter changchengzhani]
MQPIQDKDFDQLFENVFDEAEVAPSRDLWSTIESEITPKKKRIIPIYWLSAAAVLLMVGIGVLIYQKQVVKPTRYATYIAPKNEPVDVQQETSPSVNVPNEVVKETVKIEVKSVARFVNTKAKVKSVANEKVEDLIDVPTVIIAKTKIPESNVESKIEYVIPNPKEVIVLASNASSHDDNLTVSEPKQKGNKGIRNVGDVVNLIVNTVDKRKDKFIQFKTTDDESSLSSINIGPFKIGRGDR